MKTPSISATTLLALLLTSAFATTALAQEARGYGEHERGTWRSSGSYAESGSTWGSGSASSDAPWSSGSASMMAPPGGPGGGGEPTQVPVDGGLALLALAGAGFAARRLRSHSEGDEGEK